MRNQENRSPWYLLTGLIIGIGIGLLYAWWLRPISYIDTEPNSLSDYYKDRQRALIARSFMATGSLGRARERLKLLGDADMYGALSSQAHQSLTDGTDPEEARALALLSVAIGQVENALLPSPAAVSSPTPTLAIPTPTASLAAPPAFTALPTAERTPVLASPVGQTTPLAQPSFTPSPPAAPAPTATPVPTATRVPTQTPGAPFALEQREAVCDPRHPRPLLQIIALDAAGSQVAGVEIILTWSDGVERFYTGLKPELGAGYADYALDPGLTYTLRLAEGGVTVSGLTAVQCPARAGESPWGALRLTFAQP